MAAFYEIIKNNPAVLVDFSAEWCGPCKALAPILKELKTRMGDSIRILKVDVDRNQKLSAKYSIQGVPTLILFKNGNQVWRQSGVVPLNQLTQIVQNHIQ
jgi:thioredoxin